MNTTSGQFASMNGKTAVVTGASSGIGKAIALEFARAGADLIIHYARSAKAAETTAEECRAFNISAAVIQADFLNFESHPFVETIWNQHGPIDVWVNNAGVDLLTGEGATLSYDEKLTQLLTIDVSAGVKLSKSIGHFMKLRGQGCILNIGWDQADRGMEGDSAELFSTAKNAVMGFSRSLAVSLAPQVRVNCISPGWIQTEWGDQASQEWQDRVLRETPLKRWGKPSDIAKACRFLASSEADYVTGQVININGGAIR